VDDGYGPDLYGDAEDRARLLAMTELERENILAERAEARDEELQRRRTARLAAGYAGAKPAKRGAAAAAAAAADRAAARSKQPEASARRAAAAELRAARHDAATRAAGRAAARSAEPGGGEGDEGGDYTTRRKADVDDGYETGEDARPSSAATVAARARRYDEDEDEEEDGDDEAATHAEAVAAQVRRAQLARWLGEPHAARTLPGTLIRLAFGNAYMAAEVVEVVDRPPGTYRDAGRPVASPYTIVAGEVPRGGQARGSGGTTTTTPGSGPPPVVVPVPGVAAPSKTLRTHTWLNIKRGASTRLFPAHLVSNSPLSEDEFESWQRQLKRDGLRPWPRRAARAAAAAIAAGAAYTFTAADVAAMVESRRAAGGARNRAVERTRLATHHAAAVEAGDEAEASRLAADLAALDAAAEAERAARAAAAARSMDEVNRRNAERNLAISLKGVGGGGGGVGGGEGGDGDNGGDAPAAADPFKRRETRPRHMWATGRTNKAKGAGGDGEGGEDAPSQPVPAPAPAADAGPRADEVDAAELYAPVLALDLGKLSTGGGAGGGPAAGPPTTAADLARKLLGAAWAPPVRVGSGGGGNGGGQTLTLAQYFERRQGLGQ
jgi:RNA polymerase-associated protein RTF1